MQVKKTGGQSIQRDKEWREEIRSKKNEPEDLKLLSASAFLCALSAGSRIKAEKQGQVLHVLDPLFHYTRTEFPQKLLRSELGVE